MGLKLLFALLRWVKRQIANLTHICVFCVSKMSFLSMLYIWSCRLMMSAVIQGDSNSFFVFTSIQKELFVLSTTATHFHPWNRVDGRKCLWQQLFLISYGNKGVEVAPTEDLEEKILPAQKDGRRPCRSQHCICGLTRRVYSPFRASPSITTLRDLRFSPHSPHQPGCEWLPGVQKLWS